MEIFSFLVVETRWYVNLVILDDLLLQSINNISWEWNQWWMLCWTNIYQRDHLIPDSRSPTLQSSDLCSRLNNFIASQNTFCYSVKRINFGAQIEKGDFYLTKHKATIIWTLLFCIFGVYDRLKDLLVYQARSKWAISEDFDKDCDCEVKWLLLRERSMLESWKQGCGFIPIWRLSTASKQIICAIFLLCFIFLCALMHTYFQEIFRHIAANIFMFSWGKCLYQSRIKERHLHMCPSVCHKLQCWL